MSKILAYSSVTVTDYNDVGTLNLYLTSNQPTTVVYDPNQNVYTPNWASSSLVIAPVISCDGANVPLNAPGLETTWTRQEGSGTITAITSGETASGNKLTVSANKLANVTSKILTYICAIKYTDPEIGVPISAQTTLTYTLLSNATELKDANITGDSTFLYDANRTLVSATSIVLTASLKNVTVTQWQYKKADGTFAAFPTTNNSAINGPTLTVLPNESNIWINDKVATIKLVTSDSSVSDVHNIVKIYDGVAGVDTVSANLTNENHLVPVNSAGTVKSWVGAETQIKIYEGGDDVTNDWTISVAKGSGLTAAYDTSTHILTPSGLTTDASYAEFTCTKTGHANIVKRYTITKQYAGQDGEDAIIYEVTANVYNLNLGENRAFTPTAVTFSAFTKVGSAMIKSNYAGRFVISESTDGNTYSAKYTSGSDEVSKVYSPSSSSVKSIRCILYKAGGTTQQLDEQSVGTTKDGKTGIDGDDGLNGVSVVVGNDSEVIPCDSSGNAAAAKDITIPFYGFDGIARTPITCTPGTLPSGVSVKSNTAGTTSAGGALILTVASGATLGNSSLMSGDITLTLVCKGTNIEKKFTWTKSKQATNGVNAVLFQLYSTDGGTIRNGEGSTTISSMMMSGVSSVTPSSYVWSKFIDGAYTAISGKTSSTLVVTPDMVDGTAWFRCQAVYSSKTYTAYWTVNDISDPVLSYTYSTIREFQNSKGFGAIYTRVYRNGTELDPLRSTTFSSVAPTTAQAGDFYYHLDTTEKTCILKKHNGSAWVDATETNLLNYSYYRINSKGVEIDTSAPFKTDRCFYIEPSMIDKQMQFRCKVSG